MVVERLDRIEEQVKLTNGRTTELEKREIARYEREQIAERAGFDHRDTRRDLLAGVAGAVAIGAVTLVLHFLGVA